MPYIANQERRLALLGGSLPLTVGELDYALTVLCLQYIGEYPYTFEKLNSIVGVLDNVKDEFRRRILHPYEDLKRVENGDVFPERPRKVT